MEDMENNYEEIFREKFRRVLGNNLSLTDNWRIPDTKEIKKVPPKKEKSFITQTERRNYILEPFDEVILPPELLDEIIVRTSIPDLLDSRDPSYSGVILFGPPGTGKTALQKALVEAYQRAGAYSTDQSLAQINSHFVGMFAKNLESLLFGAVNQSKSRGKPSFVSFDEGSSLVQVAEDGATSFSKQYQEAIDTLKRFVGNYRELVMAVSTNMLPESFEDALTREGRLTSFLIEYPGTKERARLWELFLRKNNIAIERTPELLGTLAELTPQEQGAFVEEFCRNYEGYVRAKILREKGYGTLLSALKDGKGISEDEIRRAISSEGLIEDVGYALDRKQQRNGTKEARRIGFTHSTDH